MQSLSKTRYLSLHLFSHVLILKQLIGHLPEKTIRERNDQEQQVLQEAVNLQQKHGLQTAAEEVVGVRHRFLVVLSYHQLR